MGGLVLLLLSLSLPLFFFFLHQHILEVFFFCYRLLLYYDHVGFFCIVNCFVCFARLVNGSRLCSLFTQGKLTVLFSKILAYSSLVFYNQWSVTCMCTSLRTHSWYHSCFGMGSFKTDIVLKHLKIYSRCPNEDVLFSFLVGGMEGAF